MYLGRPPFDARRNHAVAYTCRVPRFPDKAQILSRVIDHITQGAVHMAQHAEQTRAEATHAEAKPENDKDTRALEQSYLARGQAMRAEAELEHVQVLRYLNLSPWRDGDPISAGALIELEADEGTRVLFLLPHGGGIEVHVDGLEVHVVTPASPLGKAVLGRTVGDEVQLRTRGALREYVISAVA
jgi:transcription elongation GreA/GreB family factor